MMDKVITCGRGAVALPSSRQVYSMPSGLVNLIIALVSPIVNGSYLTFTMISTPLGESAAAAYTVGASDLKSQIWPGWSSLSILTV